MTNVKAFHSFYWDVLYLLILLFLAIFHISMLALCRSSRSAAVSVTATGLPTSFQFAACRPSVCRRLPQRKELVADLHRNPGRRDQVATLEAQARDLSDRPENWSKSYKECLRPTGNICPLLFFDSLMHLYLYVDIWNVSVVFTAAVRSDVPPSVCQRTR